MVDPDKRSRSSDQADASCPSAQECSQVDRRSRPCDHGDLSCPSAQESAQVATSMVESSPLTTLSEPLLRVEGPSIASIPPCIAPPCVAPAVESLNGLHWDPFSDMCSIAMDRKVHVTVASAMGGAVTLGTGGGAIGMASGGVVGAAIGSTFALFTFGLSIPVGAALGSAAGLCMGTTMGATAGFLGGGAAGLSAYSNREKLCDAASDGVAKGREATANAADYVLRSVNVQMQRVALQQTRNGKLVLHYFSRQCHRQIKLAVDYLKEFADALRRYVRELAAKFYAHTKKKTAQVIVSAKTTVKTQAGAALMIAQESASWLGANVHSAASDQVVQITIVSAASGAVLAGTVGGLAGFTTGGGLGAVVGVVPAPLTFGLSIPTCAVLGSGIGLYTGAVMCGTVGLIGGGMTGRSFSKHRANINAAESSAASNDSNRA